MSGVYIRPPIQRHSLIPDYGLQIGTRGDRWEEEFIKLIDFSTMDDADDWSYLFKDSKAYNFDLSAMNSEAVENMDYMFQGTHADTLRLAGLTIGAECSATNFLGGTFNAIDFTGATFYSLPANMLNGATVNNGIQLRTLDVSHLTSLSGMFQNAALASLDLTGFDTSTITDMSYMFSYADIPILTGLNTLDFSNVANASCMFNNSKIPTINLSGVNFASLTNAYYMFYQASYNLANDNIVTTINLTNCRFPVIENTYEMFYMYQSNNDIEPVIILTGATFISNGADAGYMFAYLKTPTRGLDLSGFTDFKILNSNSMFAECKLALTDFTPLDFSEASGWAPFNYCETPLIHISTELPYNVTSYDSGVLVYNNKADEIILEITMPSTVATLSRFVQPMNKRGTSYLITDSELYGARVQYFIYPSSYSLHNVTFEDTVLHVGDNANADYFIYGYSYESDSCLDMSDLVIDGTITSAYDFIYNKTFDEIYLPETGIKFSGQLRYLCYGNSRYDPDTGTYIPDSPVIYNLDKLDISDVQSLYSIFYYYNGTYDLSGWDTSSVTSIDYLIQSCRGDFNLSGWDVSNVTNLNQIASSFVGNLDLRNWDLSNATRIYGIYCSGGNAAFDFDGWVVNKNQDVSYCNLLSVNGSGGNSVIIYIPRTLFQPDSYTDDMFYVSTYDNPTTIIDVYTNASSIEEQGWKFSHMYSASEPYGYRVHLNTTHNDYLTAIGGD